MWWTQPQAMMLERFIARLEHQRVGLQLFVFLSAQMLLPTNIDLAKRWGLEDDFPLKNGRFSGSDWGNGTRATQPWPIGESKLCRRSHWVNTDVYCFYGSLCSQAMDFVRIRFFPRAARAAFCSWGCWSSRNAIPPKPTAML